MKYPPVPALATILCFTTKRLLCHHSVWTSRTSVNLIFHHVVKLQHMHYTHRSSLVKRLTCKPIIKLHSTIPSDTSFFELITNYFVWHTIE